MSTTNESPTPSSPRDSKLAGWLVIAVLCAMLVGAGALGYLGWFRTDHDVPEAGYVALVLGVVFSLVVGIGLMALVFYSSRKGYDEPAVLIQEPEAVPTKEPESDPEDGRDDTR
jgi:hypothetical protein